MKIDSENISEIYEKHGVHVDRAAHSLGVAEIATELAAIHGVDPEKAWLAGALHDIARDWDELKIRNYCKANTISLNPDEDTNYLLVHGKVAANICKTELGIQDPEITTAITHHTSGEVDMSPLEMIIYTADTLESIQNLPEYPSIRSVISDSLPTGVAAVNDLSARHHLSLGHTLNQDFLNNQAFYKKYI